MTKLLILSDSHNSRLAIENILAAEADSIITVLMGDKVEPRREFIQNHALEVADLDI